MTSLLLFLLLQCIISPGLPSKSDLRLYLKIDVSLAASNMQNRQSSSHDPLSSADLVRFLIRDCHRTANEIVKEERAHTNEKIDRAFNALIDYIKIVIGPIEKLQPTHDQRLANLEKKIQEYHHVEESLAEINLKIGTFNMYHEQLLFNLKTGIQDTFHHFGNDMKILTSTINTCNNCGDNFANQTNLTQHIQTYHCYTPSTHCIVCAKLFQSRKELNEHVCFGQGNPYNSYYLPCSSTSTTQHAAQDTDVTPSAPLTVVCHLCGNIFAQYSDLRAHLYHVHGEPDKQSCNIHCKFCTETFQTMTNLNLHTHHEHMGASSKDSPTDDLRPAPSSDTLPGMSPYTIDLSCLICGKTFSDKTFLKNHCEDHTNRAQSSPHSTEQQVEHCNKCG